jgi:hypothetical protein
MAVDRRPYAERREYMRAWSRARYAADPEFREMRKHNAASSRARDPVRKKVRDAAWRFANRDKCNAAKRRYRWKRMEITCPFPLIWGMAP